ncbi:titin homolog [Xenia sp. Carnegie-2017]|uniref:titin homolog n=1 Tax=Xenia sp. Carnegie-2017 TaxID=2897299 RepID=UPI001F035F92|nr:titin homolog [Xenia sp. Carnegie-2017]
MVIITESIVQCMLKSLMDDQTVENAVNNENVKDGDCNGVEQENDVVKTSTVQTTGSENEDVKSVDITQNNREDFAKTSISDSDENYAASNVCESDENAFAPSQNTNDVEKSTNVDNVDDLSKSLNDDVQQPKSGDENAEQTIPKEDPAVDEGKSNEKMANDHTIPEAKISNHGSETKTHEFDAPTEFENDTPSLGMTEIETSSKKMEAQLSENTEATSAESRPQDIEKSEDLKKKEEHLNVEDEDCVEKVEVNAHEVEPSNNSDKKSLHVEMTEDENCSKEVDMKTQAIETHLEIEQKKENVEALEVEVCCEETELKTKDIQPLANSTENGMHVKEDNDSQQVHDTKDGRDDHTVVKASEETQEKNDKAETDNAVTENKKTNDDKVDVDMKKTNDTSNESSEEAQEKDDKAATENKEMDHDNVDVKMKKTDGTLNEASAETQEKDDKPLTDSGATENKEMDHDKVDVELKNTDGTLNEASEETREKDDKALTDSTVIENKEMDQDKVDVEMKKTDGTLSEASAETQEKDDKAITDITVIENKEMDKDNVDAEMKKTDGTVNEASVETQEKDDKAITDITVIENKEMDQDKVDFELKKTDGTLSEASAETQEKDDKAITDITVIENKEMDQDKVDVETKKTDGTLNEASAETQEKDGKAITDITVIENKEMDYDNVDIKATNMKNREVDQEGALTEENIPTNNDIVEQSFNGDSIQTEEHTFVENSKESLSDASKINVDELTTKDDQTETAEKEDSTTDFVDMHHEDYDVDQFENEDIPEEKELDFPLQRSPSPGNMSEKKPSIIDDVRDEKTPEGEEANGVEATVSRDHHMQKPVIEISSDFLELLEGFCMAAVQEFPSNVIDFAYKYFQAIREKRKVLRSQSIDVSDIALISDIHWNGNI